MKLRLKVRDIVNILVFEYRDDVARKYNLTRGDIRKVKKALRDGSWRLV
jgi:hypothetical protein